MTDTTPEIAEIVRTMLMNRTGSERFIMGSRMFDAARQLVMASLPQNLPPAQFKRQLFERIYGAPAPF